MVNLPKTLLLLACVIIGLDFFSKEIIHHYLPSVNGGGSYIQLPIVSFLGIDFTIAHLTNRGAAWGMFSDHQTALLCLRVILIVSLIIYLISFNNDKKQAAPLVLIIAGAIGNVLDYFIYGHVVDMLHFNLWGYDFPTFNIADSAISLGILWLFIQSLTTRNNANCKP